MMQSFDVHTRYVYVCIFWSEPDLKRKLSEYFKKHVHGAQELQLIINVHALQIKCSYISKIKLKGKSK
jgi:cupin superfamily acireductone dioxygenase involved in methionine salvage